MIRSLPKNMDGTTLTLPVLTGKQRTDIQRFLNEHGDDHLECKQVVRTLFSALCILEAGAVNLERTLQHYRKVVPKLLRIREAKLKEV